jgi:hypothetical protein
MDTNTSAEHDSNIPVPDPDVAKTVSEVPVTVPDVSKRDVSKPETSAKPDATKPETSTKQETSTKPDSKGWLRTIAQEKFEKFLRFILFWEKDDKRLGKIIRLIHHFIVYSGIIGYFIIHTVASSYFIFVLFYLFWGLIWLQHMIFGGCIVSDIENKLIGSLGEGIILPILDIFHISVTPESGDGIVLLSSTVVISILTCELFSRTIGGVRTFLDI